MSKLSKELIRQIIADGEFSTPNDIGMHPLPPLRGLPLPRQRLLLLGKGREVPALGDAAAQCPGQAGDTRSERGVISR